MREMVLGVFGVSQVSAGGGDRGWLVIVPQEFSEGCAMVNKEIKSRECASR